MLDMPLVFVPNKRLSFKRVLTDAINGKFKGISIDSVMLRPNIKSGDSFRLKKGKSILFGESNIHNGISFSGNNDRIIMLLSAYYGMMFKDQNGQCYLTLNKKPQKSNPKKQSPKKR